MAKRLGYAAIGFALGLLVTLALGQMLGKPLGVGLIAIPLACSSIATAIAQKFGNIKSAEEFTRPQTLFPPEKP